MPEPSLDLFNNRKKPNPQSGYSRPSYMYNDQSWQLDFQFDEFDDVGNVLNKKPSSISATRENLNEMTGTSFNPTAYVRESLPPDSQSFGEKFANSTIGKYSGAIGKGLDVVSGAIGLRPEMNGPNAELASTIQGSWDGISDAVQDMGPYGQIASLAMKAINLGNNIMGKVGGGTDGMTTTDAILGSPLGFLTGVGLINGFGGKRADTITKDEEAFELVGSSYGGTGDAVDEALLKSGKKYGLFSSGARSEANREIAEAKRQQSIMSKISSEALDRFTLSESMSAINSNRRALAMLGGYNQSTIRAAKHGLSTKVILTAKRIVSKGKYQQGGKVIDPFKAYLSSLPENQKNSTDFRVRDYWEFNGKPKDFDEAVSRGMFTQQADGWHANSVAENPTTGEIEFMKSSAHPNHHMEVDWYNSNEGAEFRSQYELLKTEPYWKYVKRKPLGEAISTFRKGGSLEEVSLNDISKEYLENYVLEEVTLDSILPEFREGGKVNVIPEGALHARLHHMENAENLTKKGIPVVSEKDGGELEQLAEIEREEIIFRLEVTKKLEELSKKYSDSESSLKDRDIAAIEAGKLLVDEILNNTIDNTGLLTNIN